MRRTLTLLILLAIIFGAAPAGAAPGDHLWSRGFDPGMIADITPDGSVVAAGMFFGSVDFGGGPLTTTSQFSPDMFVVKFGPDGAHAFSFGIAGTQGLQVKAVRADPDGGAYVMGRVFGGTIDFGGGPIAVPGGSFYVARYDASGDHLFSALHGDFEIADAEADAQGLMLVGATRSTADFGGGPLTTAGGTDAVVARLDGTGGHVYSARYGDAFAQYAYAVGTDAAGAPVIALQVAGTVDFGGGPLAPAGFGLVLLELTDAGAHVRSALVNGDFTSGITYNVHLDVDDAGAFVVAGELHGSADFGGGPLSTAGNTDVYVAGFDTDGVHQFSASYGSSSYQVVNSVCFTSGGQVQLGGNFVNTIDFGGGPLEATATTAELFLARLDATGNHLWSRSYEASSGAFSLSARTNAGGANLLVASATPDLDLGGGLLGDHYNFLGVLEGESGVTSSPVETREVLARLGNHPNPFNPNTTVSFDVQRDAPVTLTISDARGRVVLRRDFGVLAPGSHAFSWNAQDAAGRELASGVYSVTVRSGRQTAAHRMVLVQ